VGFILAAGQLDADGVANNPVVGLLAGGAPNIEGVLAGVAPKSPVGAG
jgi:hypothetical protein